MGDVGDLVLGVVACAVLAGVGRMVLSASRTHQKTLPFQLRLFTIALLIRFALAIALYQFGLVSVIGDFDAVGWLYGDSLRRAWEAAGLWFFDLPFVWTGAFHGSGGDLGYSNHVGYYYLLGTIFFLIGTASKMIAAALNCFIGALTVVFAYRTARTLFSEWVAIRVGWWSCLFPSMIIWSAQTVKEPVVILLEVVALYGCVNLKRSGFAIRYVLLCGLAIVMVIPFRFYAAYIGAAAVVVALVMSESRRARTGKGSAIGFLALFVVLLVAAGVLANGDAQLDQFDAEFIQKFRHDIADGSGSGVDLGFDMRTTSGFGLGTLVGAAYLLLAPFPWQLGGGSLRMVLTTPELLYWWWMFFAGVIPGVRYALRRRFGEVQPVLIFVVGLGLLYSMMFGNVGVVFRQRAQLLPWLFIFGGVGLEQRAARSIRRRAQLMRRPAVLPPKVPAQVAAATFATVTHRVS